MKKYIECYTTKNHNSFNVVAKNDKNLTKEERFIIAKLFNRQTKAIYQCYARPSITKQCIYNCLSEDVKEIKHYIALTSKIDINNLEVYDYGILSYNIFMFTFGALIRDIENPFLTLIYCTPSRYQIIKIYPDNTRVIK